MIDVNLEIDLFGDPVLARGEGRGRPAHVWSRENSNRVLLAFVRGLSCKDAAILVGIDVKTLRKHYFRECEQRATAKLRMEMRQLERLNAQAEQGNVGAEKELAKRIEVLRMRDASAKEFGKPSGRKPKVEQPLGKKQQRLLDAHMAGAGDEDWGDLLPLAGEQAH